MDNRIFNFTNNLSKINIPQKLNNPFSFQISEIVRIAAKEFQDFIAKDSQEWEQTLLSEKGKMFGVLVVQRAENSVGYLGTGSGKLPTGTKKMDRFVPSLFDDSVGDYFINKGMIELSELGERINMASSQEEIEQLKEIRKQKSVDLQQQLFENYQFQNIEGLEKNVLQIFQSSTGGMPPSAAGECAAPKLLQYALEQNLKPIALAEFWWGKSPKSEERKHGEFYPACKSKCKPILEFMLDDEGLFDRARG